MHRKEKNYRRYRGVANEKHRLKSVFIQSQKWPRENYEL